MLVKTKTFKLYVELTDSNTGNRVPASVVSAFIHNTSVVEKVRPNRLLTRLRNRRQWFAVLVDAQEKTNNY